MRERVNARAAACIFFKAIRRNESTSTTGWTVSGLREAVLALGIPHQFMQIVGIRRAPSDPDADEEPSADYGSGVQSCARQKCHHIQMHEMR